MSLEIELQLLQEARALIADERNWIKGTFHKQTWFGFGRDQYCAAGALTKAAEARFRAMSLSDYHTTDTRLFAAMSAARSRIDITLTDRKCVYGIVGFNDAPDTTHADVLAVFDSAIAECKHDIRKADLAQQAQTARVAAAHRYMTLAPRELVSA